MEWITIIILMISVVIMSLMFVKVLTTTKENGEMIMDQVTRSEERMIIKMQELVNENNEYLQEFSTGNLEKIEALTKQLLTENKITQQTEFGHLVDSTKNEMAIILNEFKATLDENVNKIQEEISSEFNMILTEEEVEIEKWIIAIKDENNAPSKRIAMLESALNKYPNRKYLMELYRENILLLIKSENPVIERRAIERYNRAAQKFIDNCSAKDWAFAEEVKNQSLTIGNQYMNDVQKKRLKKSTETIAHLEKVVNGWGDKKILNPMEIAEIEKLDHEIDKEFIANYPELQEKYNKLSEVLIAYFKLIEDDEVEIKTYNLKAINAIKTAYTNFSENEKGYIAGQNISKLVSGLGGWDSKYLYPATQVYFQSTYSEVFTKLQPAVKPKFTKEMVNVKLRKIS